MRHVAETYLLRASYLFLAPFFKDKLAIFIFYSIFTKSNMLTPICNPIGNP